jgi:hypothetical protein
MNKQKNSNFSIVKKNEIKMYRVSIGKNQAEEFVFKVRLFEKM